MGECFGYRPYPEIEEEPLKENLRTPGPGVYGDDNNTTDDTTDSNVTDGLGELPAENSSVEAAPEQEPLFTESTDSLTSSGVGDGLGELDSDSTMTDITPEP